MTTDEHLDRIVAKCVAIESDPNASPLLKALARSTIAAIDEMRQWHNPVVDSAIDAILAAWPEDSL